MQVYPKGEMMTFAGYIAFPQNVADLTLGTNKGWYDTIPETQCGRKRPACEQEVF